MFIWAFGIVLASGDMGDARPEVVLDRKGGVTSFRIGGNSEFHSTGNAVMGMREIEVPGDTRVFTWQEQSKATRRPYYAISLDGQTVNRVTQTSFDVELLYGHFDPLRTEPAVSPDLDDTGGEVHIVQFETQVLEAYRHALESMGVDLYGTFTNHCVLARIDRETLGAIRSLPFVRWVGAFKPAYKVEETLRAKLQGGKVEAGPYNLEVFERGGRQHSSLANFIQLIGGRVEAVVTEGFMVVATLTPDQLLQVVRRDELASVCEYSELTPDMDNIRIIGGANYVADPTRGMFRGQGVRAEVFDSGFRVTHVAFNPNTPINHNATTVQSHGTSTYGIVFGDGDGNAAGLGLMPDGQGVIGASSSYLNAGVNNRYTWTSDLLGSPYFCVFQTNSTGSSWTTTYTSISSTLDDILFLNDIVILQSQSNQGTRNSRPEAWAKNMVSVGAAYHYNNTNRSDDRWAGGASIGPATEMRIKPDLYHAYDQVLCPTSSNDTAYTTSFGGTSAATPITAGHFGLFFQMWSAGVFGNSVLTSPTPANRFVFDSRPKAATARAIMINTASQSPLPLAGGNDITRYVQGWGMADLTTLYDMRDKLFVVNETDVLTNLQTKTYKLWVPAGEPAFKATMVYLDPKGTVGASVARINDLTLKVTSPAGTIYWGNNGMVTSNWTVPGGSASLVDVVENVFVQNPQSGAWTVEVIGSDINTDARPETPGVIDADYGLAVTGVIPTIIPSSFSTSPGSLVSGSLIQLRTSDNDRMVLGNDMSIDDVGSSRWLQVNGVAPANQLSALQLRVESSLTGLGQGKVGVMFFDFSNGQWETIASGADVGATDSLITANSTSMPSRFVETGTGNVRARLIWTNPIGGASGAWTVGVDQVRWTFDIL